MSPMMRPPAAASAASTAPIWLLISTTSLSPVVSRPCFAISTDVSIRAICPATAGPLRAPVCRKRWSAASSELSTAAKLAVEVGDEPVAARRRTAGCPHPIARSRSRSICSVDAALRVGADARTKRSPAAARSLFDNLDLRSRSVLSTVATGLDQPVVGGDEDRLGLADLPLERLDDRAAGSVEPVAGGDERALRFLQLRSSWRAPPSARSGRDAR